MAVKLDACTHPVYETCSELFPQVTFISRLLAGSQGFLDADTPPPLVLNSLSCAVSSVAL